MLTQHEAVDGRFSDTIIFLLKEKVGFFCCGVQFLR